MKFTRLNEKVYADSGLGKWFGAGGKGGTTKGGWDRYNTKGEKIGKCGDKTAGEGKPKCLSANKAARMSKKEIANAVRRKRKKDPSTDRPGTGNKPINVSNRIGEERETMKSFRTFVTEKMDPTDHVKKKNGKYCVYNKNGKIVKEFDNKKEADAYAIKNHEKLMLREASAAWQRKEGKNKEGGLNAKGRASYERENPGSDLKAPVSAKTASKNPDGKAANRRKSFCARMGGMPGPMKDDKGKPTRKALALRKWDC